MNSPFVPTWRDIEFLNLPYKIDLSKTPHYIDYVIVLKKDNTVFDTMRGIFEFVEGSSNKIRICSNPEGPKRPISFVKDDTIIMNKME